MAIVSLNQAGSIGVVYDLAPAEVPDAAWTDALNVRFRHGEVQAVLEDMAIATPPAQPLWALPAYSALDGLATWLLGLESSMYAWQVGTFTNITPAGVPAGAPAGESRWSGGVLGQYTLVTDGIRVPWGWPQPSPSTQMVTLPNWDSTDRCKVIRTFKQYGIALNITKAGTSYPSMVKWSHPADPGSPPPSWDETDPTKDAGEHVLAETPGACIDCLPLKDINVIYKQDSVWGMQYVGGTYIFRFYKMFDEWGIPKQDCAVAVAGGKHIVFTGSDLVMHDGVNWNSLLSGRWKKRLGALSQAQLQGCYLVHYLEKEEVWFCYQRQGGGQGADTAVVYNYVDKTLGFRSLADYRFVASGRIDVDAGAEKTYDGLSGSFEEQAYTFDSLVDIPASMRLLGLGTNTLNWIEGETSLKTPAYWERTYAGVPMRADKAPDMTTTKFISRIWPRFTGTQGLSVGVTVGYANSVAESTVWRTEKAFIVGTSKKLDMTLTGKMLALRFSIPEGGADGITEMTYSGLDLEVIPGGTW